MNKESILSALKELREKNQKRNFSQTVDLIVILKGLDLKKPEHKVDSFIVLPNQFGKKIKICSLIDKELVQQAKETFDKVITKEQFPLLKKQEIKKLAREFDFFVAQANLMVEIAKYLGKSLGARGKMPNPKSGCVVPPNANLKLLYEKLQKTVRIQAKSELAVKCQIGKEALPDEELAANVLAIYDNLIKILPGEKTNIAKILFKFTMSSPIGVRDE